MPQTVLIVDDEDSMREMLRILMTREGLEAVTAPNASDALQALSRRSFDLVISDIRMPGLSGIDLLRKIREEDLDTEVVLMTAYASTESAIEALKLGAFDYVTKPFQVDELLHTIHLALEKRSLSQENILLKADLSQKDQFGEMIGGNPRMRQIYALIERIAPAGSTILIHGESGTGKELVARAIHQRSARASHPFVTVNCGGIPETLLESELFGHIKGAYTGAYATKKGLFDMASGGTIFLDEIGEMTPAMQVKLLRTLQEKRVRPVGASEDHPVDIRIIAATNRNLETMVAEKQFREDLYYRINVISIGMPPLRERREDIALLATHFLKQYAESMGKPTPSLSRDALDALESHPWPGNIRELENVVERAIAIANGPRIERSHLPETLQGNRAPRGFRDVDVPPSGFDLNDAVEGVRKVYIQKALELEGGNLTRAAKRLGITFRSIRHFVKKYDIQAKDIEE